MDNMNTPNPETSRLHEIISEEREALLAGNFDRIAELLDEKQALVATLDNHPPEPHTLEPLQDGLRRNQELFDQALAGIRNVANRLGELGRVRRSLDTYNEKGQRFQITTPARNRLEKRA
jgi:hypothetical protein